MTGAALAGAKSLRTMRAWLVVSLVVPLLLFLAAACYDRSAILHGAKDRLRATNDALSAHAEAVLETASLALSLQLDAVKNLDWASIGQSSAVHQFLVGLDRQLPQVELGLLCRPGRVQLGQQPRLSDATL